MHHRPYMAGFALVACVAMTGCRGDQTAATTTSGGSSNSSHVATVTVPAGTSLDITLGTTLSSESANIGDAWSGTVQRAIIVRDKTMIPSGSTVSGRVSGARAAKKGDRAMLDLELTSVTVDGRTEQVHGTTEAVIAGSTRARNLGAIAGSAAAGALIGKATSGTGKGAAIGGLIGAGVATGVVARSDGYQVELKAGTPLTFTTNESVAMRP